MRKLMIIAALVCLFAGMQSGNFVTFLLAALIAYVFIEAAESMEKE